MKKLLTKLSVYKIVVSVKWTAIKYACTQWAYFSRPWKEAYDESIRNMVYIIASLHDDMGI